MAAEPFWRRLAGVVDGSEDRFLDLFVALGGDLKSTLTDIGETMSTSIADLQKLITDVGAAAVADGVPAGSVAVAQSDLDALAASLQKLLDSLKPKPAPAPGPGPLPGPTPGPGPVPAPTGGPGPTPAPVPPPTTTTTPGLIG